MNVNAHAYIDPSDLRCARAYGFEGRAYIDLAGFQLWGGERENPVPMDQFAALLRRLADQIDALDAA